ncbi:MAG: peptidase U37 [Planctomycetota bacterium]|nr:MAG: peptidase U37 [Planctomycetota bacterium]
MPRVQTPAPGLNGQPQVALLAVTAPETLNAESRTIEVLAYAGARVRIDPWFSEPYLLELSLEPGAVILDRFNAGAPVVDTHSTWSVESVLGVIEKAWVASDGLHARVRFSKRPEVDGIWQDVAAGILRNFSVGPIYHKIEKVEEEDDKLPVYRATSWEPAELSLCAVGRDPKAQALAQPAAPAVIVANFAHAAPAAAETVMTPKPKTDGTGGAPATPAQPGTPGLATGEPPAPTPPPAGTPPQAPAISEAQRAAEDARLAERHRGSEITRMVRAAGLSAESAETWINDGLSVDEARSKIQARLAARSDASAVRPHHTQVTDATERASRDGAVLALLHRSNPGRWKLDGAEGEAAREFVGMSAMEIAKDRLERHGVRTRGLGKMETANLAFQGTSDFPNILSSLANRTLRAAYDETPKSFPMFCRRATLPDFRDKNLVQLSEIPTFGKVNQHGELRQANLRDAKQSYRLYTYGLKMAFTREMLVNDDIGLLTRVQQGIGAAGARTESDVVWGLITANGALGDGVALFHASHGNLLTGGGSVLAVAGLTDARVAMRKQKGLDGKTKLDIMPRFLLVPVALQTAAQQLTTSEFVPNEVGKVNPFASALTPIAEPRLDDVATIGTTAWYFAADPNAVDTIEYGYLEGQEGIRIEFAWGIHAGVDGLLINVTHDFGASVVDHRGLNRSNGQ